MATGYRTRTQVQMNPTVAELKAKAFDERKRKWIHEDEEEENRLLEVGETIADSLLNTVDLPNEQQEDMHVFLLRYSKPLIIRNFFLLMMGILFYIIFFWNSMDIVEGNGTQIPHQDLCKTLQKKRR